MIVMKFGGTSVGEAERLLAVASIVRSNLHAKPVVVVSALAGVTDSLVRAIEAAARGDRDGLEPLLASIERRHRWALHGAVEDSRRRHDLGVALDALFEELRQLMRAVRVLGEGTPRASDELLAFGELLSSRILEAVLQGQGIRARRLDPREVVLTDGRHGSAEPDLDAMADRARRTILPVVEAGEVPVIGGFVGAGPDGRTTTLGRGGSDTTASALAAAIGAEEIQIWTDVDGLMTADPKIVPEAKTLPRVSFAEAAELAFYGARVLHPAAIAPAVARGIPVRVLNSLNPSHPGTLILGEDPGSEPRLASIASRSGVLLLRFFSRRMRSESAFLPRIVAALEREGLAPALLVSSELSVSVAVAHAADVSRLATGLAGEFDLSVSERRGLISAVGSVLLRDGATKARVLRALAEIEPEAIGFSGAGPSASAVVSQERLEEAVRALHRRFIEPVGRVEA
jgi:aspartate kinase